MNRFTSSIGPSIGLLLLLALLGTVWQISAWRLIAHEHALIGAIGHPQPLNDRIFHYAEGGSRLERQVFVIPITATVAAMLLVLVSLTVVFVRRTPLGVAAAWLAAIAIAGIYLAANLHMYALATNTFV